jgi:nucleotide-binding universal stress UspA family protein
VFEEASGMLPDGFRAKIQTIVGHQPAKQGIVAAAESCGADLIGVGARGLGPIERLLLGSVSLSVVHSSHVPVYVARPRAAVGSSHPLRVLIAYESAIHDRHLADVVKSLRWPSETQGFTLTVVQSMFAGHVPIWLKEKARSEEVEAMAKAWVTEHEMEIEQKRAELSAFDALLATPFQANPPIVDEGHPAEKILATIAERKIDLVVMGAGKPSAVTRFFVGSTSQSVLSNAGCSVLIARTPEQP